MVLCTCCYDLWFQGWWVVCSWDRQPHDHCCQPKTVQDPRLVLEQTERLQGREVLSSCLQRPWHEAQGWSWTSQENQVKSPNTDSDQINLLNTVCSLMGFKLNEFACKFGFAFRNHRGLRHYWGLRVRGQHTKTTGRRGKTVGVSKKR